MSPVEDVEIKLFDALERLRALGVAKFEDTEHGVRVEFFPVAAAPAAPEKPKPTNDPEMCACKHHLHVAHVNGLCVEGCSAEECNPPQK